MDEYQQLTIDQNSLGCQGDDDTDPLGMPRKARRAEASAIGPEPTSPKPLIGGISRHQPGEHRQHY
jgi:hypothetical protein